MLGFLTSALGASPPLEAGVVTATDQPAAAPTMTKITPTSGPVGTQVTVTGTGFTARGNTVKFGTGYVKNLESADGTTLRFTIPEGLDLCAPDSLRPCPGAYPQVAPGEYAVAVLVDKDTSNAVTFTVTR
jgi:hypothetical protein